MSTALDDAFAAVAREDFLPADQRRFAYLDRPLPIGHGATNSQPWTVRHMLTLLDVQPGHRVLDVGSGSGWTAALLGYLVGQGGEVTGVDIVPELVEDARAALGDRYPWVRFELAAPGVLGLPEGAPWDRILVSANAARIPDELEDQLAPGGRMVLPVAGEMTIVERASNGTITRSPTGGLFSFVPLR